VTGFNVDLAGANLAGEFRRGSGKVPLVLVHGFGGSRRDWDAVVAGLGSDTPVIAYDQRGFGKSRAEPGVPFSHADDLAALLDTLALEQVDVCGLSLGGSTALGLALNAPERVRRLVLVSPMLAGWSWSAEWVELWKAIGRAARGGDLDLARSLWWQHPLFATTRATAGAAMLEQSIASFAGRQWVQDDQRDDSPMASRLHAVRTPTLLLSGGLDLADFRRKGDVLETAIPDIMRIDDPSAGHLLTLERPEAVAAAISDFLAAS
jgi:2-succinyl-6-hydroxy-2,4-cyclohexadiene-1-carboxylate synthase